jgi:hypothetical protein
MLKTAGEKRKHRPRTMNEALEEVKKEEEVQFSFYLPKSHRTKYRRKAEDMGYSMAEKLREHIANFIK